MLPRYAHFSVKSQPVTVMVILGALLSKALSKAPLSADGAKASTMNRMHGTQLKAKALIANQGLQEATFPVCVL